MPNTLAHLGIQAVVTRSLIKAADLKWICLGCIIPDVPWILQRIVALAGTSLSPYDLRLYAVVQSSLLFSLLLCAAFAVLSRRPGYVFAILALNSLLHLLLDALQMKWGNGVHLFAPASWHLLNFGLFWPESVPTVILTAGSLIWIVYWWQTSPGTAVDLYFGRRRQILLGSALTLAYFLMPLALLTGPGTTDSHFVQTLRQTESRTGALVAFDRNFYVRRGDGGTLRTFAGEEINVRGIQPPASTMISARGRFVDARTVELIAMKTHWPLARDLASIVGLLLVALIWVGEFRRLLIRRG